MNIALVFIILVIFIVGIAILIHKSGAFSKPTQISEKSLSEAEQEANAPPNQFLPDPAWSKPIGYPPGGTGGQCLIYTFLGGQYTPAVPSLNYLNQGGSKDILPPQQPDYTQYACLDVDQLFSYNISHECVNPNGTSAGVSCVVTVPTYDPTTGNTYQSGQSVPKGVIEGYEYPQGGSKLYAQCTPSNIGNNQNNSNYCLGSIGLVIPNFVPQNTYDADKNQALICNYNANLINATQEYTLTLQTSDLSEPQQIFRMTRFVLNDDGTLTQDDNGYLASIVHRYTGFYLAPSLQFNTIVTQGSGGNTSTTYNYIFDAPNIKTYGSTGVSDISGHKFPTYIDTVLINPQYDTYRNGVYWLLQNRTTNPAHNEDSLNFGPYKNVGIYANQLDYGKQYPNAPLVPSYYFRQTVDYCSVNPGVTGCNDNPAPLTISTGSQHQCFYGTVAGTTGNDGLPATSKDTTISNIPIDSGVQQIVYVPDLNLLPNLSTSDPSTIWSYLINNFSINIIQYPGTGINTPVLTPYRNGVNADITYACQQENGDTNGNYPNNYFTLISSVEATPQDPDSGKIYGDSQFINYSNFITQIQMGVVAGDTQSSGFSGKSNPFISITPNG